MIQAVLGIDVAKKSFEASLQMDGKLYHHTFRNEGEGYGQMSHWLKKHKFDQLQACMEATGRYWEGIADYLLQQGHRVSVVNPARVRDYARSKLVRNKTDKLDADIIADFCATQKPPAWVPPAPEVRELQALVRYLEDLQKIHNQESNRLQAEAPSGWVKQSLETHLEFLKQQIQALEQQIEQLMSQHAALKQQRDLLVTIPGIGEKTAHKLLSENIQSFTSTRAVVAYAGMNPQWKESGSSVHGRPHLSKIGRASLRKSLYLPALVAMKYNPIIQAHCERMDKRGKVKMVQLGAAMRKLLCLALGVLKSGKPFDPNYSHSMQATP
jgi:transposase